MAAVDKFGINLTKPLIHQVGHLGERYEEWIHEPSPIKENRIVENEYIEWLERVNWRVIAVVWPPVICWLISLSIRRGLSTDQLMIAAGCGLLFWTFLEYCLHRFLFHMKPKSYWGIIIQFSLHGHHHKFPLDRTRLLVPPHITTALVILIWGVVRLVTPASATPAFMGGSLFGYWVYDLVHYYLHTGKTYNAVTQQLKKHHLVHHYKDESKGYGVTSLFWDRVFGTELQFKPA
ncbi:hypothetical protein Droror1_Dr00007980 [Drosera rotundifolia]